MRIRSGLLLVLVLASASCSGLTSRKFEYEEEIFLALDGSATVYVNASLPALVALRGAPLPVDPAARLDRQVVRDWYESPVSGVVNVNSSRRDNRRYVHVRINVPDIRRLAEAPPFAWSTYSLVDDAGLFKYSQQVHASAARDVGQVGWTGRELVAFRIHLPSKVPFHNAPSRTIERGNIIVWEQPLADRLKGTPIDIQVHMDRESILVRTLTLFAVMIVLVAATFVAAIWWVRSRRAPL
ncbi:MAG: hypothetical protein ABI665_08655 [Vicinamibacterales bacterium]